MASLTDVLSVFVALAMFAGVVGVVCLFLRWMRHADQAFAGADARRDLRRPPASGPIGFSLESADGDSERAAIFLR